MRGLDVHAKAEWLSGYTGSMLGGLFVRATINFSVLNRVIVSLSVIYYKYVSYYLILEYVCMGYAFIELI